MIETSQDNPTTYDLPSAPAGAVSATVEGHAPSALTEPLLVDNVVWFCHLRWIAISILTGFGILSYIPAAATALGLAVPGVWPFVIAAVLAVCNVAFLVHARVLRRPHTPAAATRNLWCQVVLDLLILTGVVHFAGSRETLVCFVYLSHIVLACIFLSRPQSLLVVLLAVSLYLGCLFAERLGILTPRSIYAGDAPGPYVGFATWPLVLNLISAVSIWLVVWYLGSRLAMMVRKRDNELARTNRRLSEAMAERSRHMLRTTHELKAPFAAIQAYAQVLLDGYCGELPEEATRVVERIHARSRRLGGEIQEMLQLADLDSSNKERPVPVRLDLAEVLNWCAEQVGPVAERRRIEVVVSAAPTPVDGVPEHLRLLLMNLVLNAVVYSHEGGQVRLACAPGGNGRPTVTIADDGIGIPADKLPKVFEDHYRTSEAVKHNQESSGLGLGIVARIARLDGIGLRVRSRVDQGTTFELRFTRPVTPSAGRGAVGAGG